MRRSAAKERVRWRRNPSLSNASAASVITLNRPKVLNALSDTLMDSLGQALLAFDADDEVGVMVIAGSSRAFAAGADISAMADWTYSDVYKSNFITRNWETIRQVRKPVIASVAGLAIGGGCELALACDIVVAVGVRNSVCRRSSSVCCPAQAERNACRARSARPRRWTCVYRPDCSTPMRPIATASSPVSLRTTS
jgi:hypothetical protein